MNGAGLAHAASASAEVVVIAKICLYGFASA
jgi:hypothetical protein